MNVGPELFLHFENVPREIPVVGVEVDPAENVGSRLPLVVTGVVRVCAASGRASFAGFFDPAAVEYIAEILRRSDDHVGGRSRLRPFDIRFVRPAPSRPPLEDPVADDPLAVSLPGLEILRPRLVSRRRVLVRSVPRLRRPLPHRVIGGLDKLEDERLNRLRRRGLFAGGC